MPSVRAESAPSQLEAIHPPPMPSLRALGEYIQQMVTLALFGIIGLVVCPVCTLILAVFGDRVSAARGRNLIRALFSWWLRFSIRIGTFEIDFPAAAKLAAQKGGIIAPNHPSLLDAVMLLATIPDAVCIMRSGLMNSPFLGGAAKLARFIGNDEGAALIRDGVERLHRGENLLIFPEGTRSHRQGVNPFKKGFALMATKTGAPIQTVFIEREGRYLGKGVSLLAPATLPIRLRVSLGEVVRPEPGESAQQLARRLEDYFRAHLENTGDSIRLTSPPIH